jgi:F-type H+-transporting ATPase subunit b
MTRTSRALPVQASVAAVLFLNSLIFAPARAWCMTAVLPQDSATTQQQPNTAAQSHAAAAPETSPAELAEASREAAGEQKDETAEFKHSASVRWLAKITGLTLQQAYMLGVGLNFAVLAGVILWFSRKGLPKMFRARTAAIQQAMLEARKASDEARKRLTEIENRLSRLDSEIEQMRASAGRDAAAEEERIKAAAEEDARRIAESAGQEIAAAAKAARRELTKYAADLAVSLAGKQIKVDTATDQRLLRDFTGQLSNGRGKDRA